MREYVLIVDLYLDTGNNTCVYDRTVTLSVMASSLHEASQKAKESLKYEIVGDIRERN